ncbi:hypothetical protein CR513_28737, partial [Mucuna pruriens]
MTTRNTKKIQLTKSGIFEMPHGERITVSFDRQMRAYREATSLVVGAYGRITTDSKNISINFDSWPKVLKSYKDGCFNTLKTSKSNAKTLLFTYHVEKGLCQKNFAIRKNKIIPHTGDSKLLSTKQHEINYLYYSFELMSYVYWEVELRRVIGRGELYIATHKKKMDLMSMRRQGKDNIRNEPNLSKILGKDYDGHVHCLELGGFSGVGCSFTNSHSVESSRLKEKINSLKDKLASSQKNFKTLKKLCLHTFKLRKNIFLLS